MTTIQRLTEVGVDPRNATELIGRFRQTRAFTESMCEPMVTEDYVIQSMPDVSPTKWHLAHTTWFFETFILSNHYPDYKPLNSLYNYLFNSYYNAVGEQFCRPRRGQISRPTVAEVYDYRHYVDARMIELIEMLGDEDSLETIREISILGINHEQQHQELMATDIKHVLSMNPLYPTLHERPDNPAHQGVPDIKWFRHEAGLHAVGHEGNEFHFDNEGPSHQVYLNEYEIASRLVTNGEFMDFIQDGGYQRPDLWLALGWSTVQENELTDNEDERWNKPLYWKQTDDGWMQYTLAGLRPVNTEEPLVHVSYFEADAYARWAGARLPTEDEWEVASRNAYVEGGNYSDNLQFHPRPLSKSADPDKIHQMFGDVWEWTSSSYSAYPGYKPAEGALGEYNGKFMVNQVVLRGGSCATPQNHIRSTYRNFFYAADRWQFMGARLARDI